MAASTGRRVLIAGGGIGGLCAALAAHGAGAEVVVFERTDDPLREAGTAFNLWGNAVTALERIGLGQEVRDAGDPIERMLLRDHRGGLIGETPIADIGRRIGTTSVNIRRSELSRLLYQACVDADIPVHTGTGCAGYRETEKGVALQLADGRVEEGAVLVGADGARSTIRNQLVGDGEPLASSFPIRGIAQNSHGTEPNTVTMVWGPRGGGAGCWPLADGTVSWTVGATSPLKRRLDAGDDPKRAVLDFVAGFPAPFHRLIESTPGEGIVVSPVLVREKAEIWGSGPVTLLGDAAHAMPTVFAQGACQAVEDAVVLGAELAAATDPVDALRAYEARRKPRMDWLRKRIFTLDKLQKFENRLMCMIRNFSTRKAPADKSARSWEQMLTFDLTPVS
ncbi:FAD-dependent oxidoreductase [Saccharomonospora piscinae]|uniref:FAD-dependent oxidoreductase n=1 Tax=Saccharomonospora piscinae TaxID=687388 RepID=UPI000463B1CC|nr:FAD-dependent monooxygenase [Saccharomonospora piscinae]